MKNINKWLPHLIALISILGLFLVNYIVEREEQHKQEIYELKMELNEAEFKLEMATMHIETLNKEREEK